MHVMSITIARCYSRAQSVLDVETTLSIAIRYKPWYTRTYEIQSPARKSSQNPLASYRRGRLDRFAPGRANRIQTSAHLELPESQARLEFGGHGQGFESATPFRARSAGSE